MEGTMACSQQVTVLQGTFNALLAVLSDKDSTCYIPYFSQQVILNF